jgi:uncharacterized membrane protein
MAAFYMIAGANHFINPKSYLNIMLPYLPLHLFLVLLSGFFETALGILILVPKYTSFAAWGLIILLILIFPANIHMAINSELYRNIDPVILWLRLPLQLILIVWAYYYTKPKNYEI